MHSPHLNEEPAHSPLLHAEIAWQDAVAISGIHVCLQPLHIEDHNMEKFVIEGGHKLA